MPNTQLGRIATKVKSIQTFTIPPVPKLPERMVRQFHLEGWEADWELWRQNAQETIRAALQAIRSEGQ